MHDDLDEPLRLPPAPPAPPRPGLPVAAAIVPVVGAVVLWQLTGSPTALWFAALGPLMAVASFADGLRSMRRAKRRARREAADALADLDREVEERHDVERRRAWRRTPDVAGYADDPDEIWRVVPGRDEVIVVGRGVGRSALRVDGDAQATDARDVRRRARTLDDMPVHVPLMAGIAVCGPPVLAEAVVRALVVQLCLAQSPGQLRLVGDTAGIGAGADGGGAPALPHAEATRGAVVFAGSGERPVPADADIPIVRVAEGAPPPPRCAAVLTLDATDSARLDHDGSSRRVRIEAISHAQAGRVAAALAERAATLGQRVDHLHRQRRHLGLGVARRGGTHVARRAEVALTFGQRIAQRPRLHEAHERVVNRRVAVRVELAHHVADDAGALVEALVGAVTPVVHAVDHAAVHGLQAIAHIGERATDDDAHRVVEVAALHLDLQVDLVDVAVVVVRVRIGAFFVSHDVLSLVPDV